MAIVHLVQLEAYLLIPVCGVCSVSVGPLSITWHTLLPSTVNVGMSRGVQWLEKEYIQLKEPMIKYHVQLKLFAHEHNVKQVMSTSTMCCVGSPCVFWPRQTEHETHHRPTFYSQVVHLTADQQSESQPLILSNVGPSLIMLIGRSSMSVLQTFMLPCCLTVQMKMCQKIIFWLCSVLPSSTSLLASTSLAVLWFAEAETAHQSFLSSQTTLMAELVS